MMFILPRIGSLHPSPQLYLPYHQCKEGEKPARVTRALKNAVCSFLDIMLTDTHTHPSIHPDRHTHRVTPCHH